MRRITDYELNQKMIEEYNLNLLDYNKMQKYYNGEHDIIANYYNIEGRSNQITVDNFVQKFIDEEVNYSLGNAITITSRTGNTDIINAINKNTGFNPLYKYLGDILATYTTNAKKATTKI